MPVARYSPCFYSYCDEPIPSTELDPDGDLVRYEDYAPVERVALAACEWARCKTAAQAEWIEHGKVSAKTGVSLDKATDNLLTAADAWTP